MALAPGQNIGGYQILEQIGRGGMATVFKARQISLSRFVAIKVLPTFFAEDQTFRERFQNEATAIARLRHPNILAVYDYGDADGVPYIVTEFVSGGTLSARLGAPLSPSEALDLLRPIASALDYSHSRGIIHRDIKPSNILIDEDGRPVLADFGVAFILANTERLTATGFTVGTPAYMAPEQSTGGRLGTATDVYALTIVLYEMLTGRVPFSGDSPLAVAIAHVHNPPPPPRAMTPGVSEAVQQVVLNGLAKEPHDRFQTAGALVAALETAVRARAENGPATVPLPVDETVPLPTSPTDSMPTDLTEPMPTSPTDILSPAPAPAPDTLPARRAVRMDLRIAIPVVIVFAIAGFVLAGRENSESGTNPVPTVVARPATPVQTLTTQAGSSLSAVAAAAPTPLAPPGVWQVFGFDGAAQRVFNQPSAVATDALGAVYVADTFGHQFWKFSPIGQELGHWGAPGTGAGQLRQPHSVAVDRQGNMYIADTENHRIQTFAADGRLLAQWGTEGNRAGQFAQPRGVAVDASGAIYVSDTGNDRIQVLSAQGQSIAQWGRPGTGPAQFNAPSGVAVDGQGNVYVADTNNNRIQKLSRDGQSLALWGGEGGGLAQFRFPQAVALDNQGRIYVADSRNHRVQRLTPQGAYSATWGGPGSAPGQFASPQGLAIDPQGVLYVADTDNNRVQRINLGGT